MSARITLNDGILVVKLADYPSYAVGDVLNAFSLDGKACQAPSDYDSQADWVWRVPADFCAALIVVLRHYRLEVLDETG